MPEETTNSSEPAKPKSGLTIKIGSQRGTAARDARAESIDAGRDAHDPVRREQDAGRPERVAQEVTPVGSADTEMSVQSGSQAAEVDADDQAAVDDQAESDAEVATEDGSTPEPAGVPSLDVDPTEDDLESEIAAALGGFELDALVGGRDKAKAAAQEIEIDGRYPATVIKIFRESVLFELPGQRNGIVPVKQFETPPEPGAQLEVIVTGESQADQLYELLVPGASVDVADWSDLAEGVVVDAKITGHNKGGLECEVNHIRGFIPASQVSLYRVDDLSRFENEKLPCVVTEANPQRRNLVLSHRAVLEREQAEKREKLLDELEVGQTREGVVTRLQNFGAFVDLGGIDGLIHISQLSWDRIRHPSEVLEEGQRVQVRIDKIDKTAGKIGLSYRDLMHHPWEGIETKYVLGGVFKGTVSKLADFGAFVKLEPGVEGLVHISELSHQRVSQVSHVVQEGQEVDVKVLSIDPSAQRISLSMKAAQGEIQTDDDDGGEDDAVAPLPKRPPKSLKGGVERKSGGEQFGLKW